MMVGLPDHVAQGMVLLVDGEDGSIGHLGVLLSCDLLLSVKQQKRLERWWSVHFFCKKIKICIKQNFVTDISGLLD